MMPREERFASKKGKKSGKKNHKYKG